ncbi:MAG: FkbM family methyltransferase [Planctomycetales bacterium]|nr:FkbM family methyltransferase [Planctomycetales bacterium]
MKLTEKLRLWHRAWRFVTKTEKHEIALVRSVVRPGDFVLDIGAHKAGFTYWMSKSAGAHGKVIAFEPIPHLAAYLRDVATVVSGAPIEVAETALSNSIGTADLYFPGPHLGCASLETTRTMLQDPITVPTTTLDEFLADGNYDRRVSFLKCDVEHHELAVFQGAMETLSRHRPIMLFESGNLHNGADHHTPVFELLKSLGYVGHFFDESRLVQIEDFDPDAHDAPDDGYQNFLFSHPDQTRWEVLHRPFVASDISMRAA